MYALKGVFRDLRYAFLVLRNVFFVDLDSLSSLLYFIILRFSVLAILSAKDFFSSSVANLTYLDLSSPHTLVHIGTSSDVISPYADIPYMHPISPSLLIIPLYINGFPSVLINTSPFLKYAPASTSNSRTLLKKVRPSVSAYIALIPDSSFFYKK